MRDNTRRNRNIGTSKQGYGLSNKMKISDPFSVKDFRIFTERLTTYTKEIRCINGHEFEFIVETLNKNFVHACSVDDVAYMLQYIPAQDYGDLRYIVFRQPKRKEAIMSSVWGRLTYSYEFEGQYYPAIMLESQNVVKKLKWARKLKVNDFLELERLKKDGHIFTENKRFFEIEISLTSTRNTQLYRTFLHEFGHYVHYLNVVERARMPNEDEESEPERWDYYRSSITKAEKEKFAHNYADSLREKLLREKVIPFETNIME